MAQTNAELLLERFNQRFVAPVVSAWDATAAQREAAQAAAARQAASMGLPPVVAQPRLTESPGSPPPAIGASLAFTPNGPAVNLPAPAAAAARAVQLPQPARAPAAPPAPAAPRAPQVLSTAGSELPYGFRDPSGAISTGLDQQLLYQRLALENATKAAASGDPRNASYRFAAAMGTLGTNNFGTVQQQGVEALNRALGDMQQSEMQTETARANALTSANAQLGAANIGASAQRYGDNLQMERFRNTFQDIGEVPIMYRDPKSGAEFPMGSQRLRALPQRGGSSGTIPDGQRTTLGGQSVIMKGGKWVPYK